jgi:hypothetical protein
MYPGAYVTEFPDKPTVVTAGSAALTVLPRMPAGKFAKGRLRDQYSSATRK